ncbi:MAG: 23S rRNA pseudouridine1911/1915/1917 synthase [Myxococcota bacterium]|jgi:23S rRNA pseudouridine1911/1915/1917 synthase
MRHRFKANADGRLDKLIAENTKLSRKRAKTLIKRGGVRVDGQVEKREGFRTPEGAVVELRTTAISVAVKIVDVWRDKSLLVVIKPSGLASQPTRNGEQRHLYGALMAREGYIGLHHRLDTPASGLILVTLDRNLNRPISEALQSGGIERRYRVAVIGDPGPSGKWTAPINGKPAQTHWTRLSCDGHASVLDVTLGTGRTHQIRRHASDAGHPVLGDRRHGGAAGRAWERLALHAWRLSFTHPLTNEPITVTAPLPPDLTDLFDQLGYSEE